MNKDKLKSSILTPVLAVALFAGGATGIAALASAQTSTTTGTTATTMQGMHRMGMGPGGEHGKGQGVMGTVSAVSGNTVTVTNSNGTTYTVDASNAKISKMVDLTVSDIKVGDTIGVRGTLSGTSVTASHIMDGIPQGPQSH